MSTRPTLFSGSFLDRRAELRGDPEWIAAARADPGTLYALAAGPRHLVNIGSAMDVALLRNGDALVSAAADQALTLLGWFRGERTVLIEFAPDAVTDAAAGLPRATELQELRPLAPLLPAALLPLLLALVLDPAIIVLVTDQSGERALLGRQAAWPAGRYSTIAGFVEPGESLEEAVIREVAEETGVQVGDIRYDSSQPWPFPSSLMLGFHAVARTEAITLRDGELEDARWFTRADVAAGHPALPPPGAISARLIDAWFNQPDGPPQRW